MKYVYYIDCGEINDFHLDLIERNEDREEDQGQDEAAKGAEAILEKADDVKGTEKKKWKRKN